MAGKDRNSSNALTLLESIRLEPYRFGFYSAVRQVNCAFPDSSPTGRASRPAQDPVRFGQSPHTNFASSTLSEVQFDDSGGSATIRQNFFGLFGPNGPLPLHLTEYALRRRHQHDLAFCEFADMFHHRMISLFYRAWSQGQPTVQADRPGMDRFSFYIGSLAGLGEQAFHDTDRMPHRDKLHFSGHLGSLPKHAEGLAALIQKYFKIPARVIEFVGHWLEIPVNDRLKLGLTPDVGVLGQNAILGERVWQRQDKFQIFLGPLTMEEYESFLPASDSYHKLVAAVRNYLGLELLWEIRLLLKRVEKPACCLGKQGVLGWTSWMSGDQGKNVIDDLVLQTAR